MLFIYNIQIYYVVVVIQLYAVIRIRMK